MDSRVRSATGGVRPTRGPPSTATGEKTAPTPDSSFRSTGDSSFRPTTISSARFETTRRRVPPSASSAGPEVSRIQTAVLFTPVLLRMAVCLYPVQVRTPRGPRRRRVTDAAARVITIRFTTRIRTATATTLASSSGTTRRTPRTATATTPVSSTRGGSTKTRPGLPRPSDRSVTILTAARSARRRGRRTAVPSAAAGACGRVSSLVVSRPLQARARPSAAGSAA